PATAANPHFPGLRPAADPASGPGRCREQPARAPGGPQQVAHLPSASELTTLLRQRSHRIRSAHSFKITFEEFLIFGRRRVAAAQLRCVATLAPPIAQLALEPDAQPEGF